jgi:hypothetical protein
MRTDSDQQVERLAKALGALNRTIPNVKGNIRQVWYELLDKYGFDETRQILMAAYNDRNRFHLLNDRFPVFTAHHVKLYSQHHWSRERYSPSGHVLVVERENFETEDDDAHLSNLTRGDVHTSEVRRRGPF